VTLTFTFAPEHGEPYTYQVRLADPEGEDFPFTVRFLVREIRFAANAFRNLIVARYASDKTSLTST